MKTPTITLKNANRGPVSAILTPRHAAFGLAMLLASQQGHAAEYDWNNSGTDFNAASSYSTSGGVVETAPPPVATDVYYKLSPVTQPQVTASIAIGGLNFAASGYDITSVAGATLTLNGYGTSATGTTSSSGAAIYSTSAATGTNTIEVPVLLASSNGTSVPTIYQAGVGGNLVLSGTVSGTQGINLTIAGGSTVTLSGANSFSGVVTLSGTNLSGGPATLALGDNAALGTSSVTFSSGDALAASGGARTISNNILYGGSGIITGTNNLTLSGNFTSSGSNSRSLTVSNTGVTTLSGNVYLAPDNTTARGLVITGGGAVNVSAPIANNASGNTVASTLSYSGTSTLTVTGNNTYTGTTSIADGTFKAASTTGKALGGTSAITIDYAGVLLFAASNQLNATTPAPVTLGVGASPSATIRVGGFSQGSTTTNGIGVLTLATGTTNNVVDFGNASGLITFAGLATNSLTLTINNYVANGGAPGGADQLIFNQDETANLANIVFTGYGAATEQLVSGTAGTGNAFYEVFPAVPEPSTTLAIVVLTGALGWSQRRRVGGWKSAA